jgi:hypothetical protein
VIVRRGAVPPVEKLFAALTRAVYDARLSLIVLTSVLTASAAYFLGRVALDA